MFSVPLAEFSIEDPWAVPAVCTWAKLRRATDGSAPRLATSVTGYFDDAQLTFVFRAIDDEVVATQRGHDAPLYQGAVVESFLAPHRTAAAVRIASKPH